MRVLIKILLFPITLILTILILFFDFVCLFSTAVLSILSFVVFMIALGTIFILRETSEGIRIIVLAYLISPYGIPMFAAWLIAKIEGLNDMLKSI